MSTTQHVQLCTTYEVDPFGPSAWDMFYLSNRATSTALSYWGLA